ncbi:hypothetical protein [Pontibacter fetidus]|uniref:Uncharacterized protein n=1 Tax=Pontibacter fetidus TaxID=2700082 RepID=A0A6B2H2Y2_9BACT|nr:hypothetical protein [Pontibacter fetidus]NDK54976.1 hypothetical protein [Pontibacter fetidus]
MKHRKPYKIFKNQTNLYIFLVVAVLLLIVSSFHYLTNYTVYWSQPAVKRLTQIGSTTFELLDYQQSPNRCWHGHENENLYLFYVSSTDRNSIIEFLENFKSLNYCYTLIFFQRDKVIEKNWKEAVYMKAPNIVPPARAFASSFYEQYSYSLADLVNRKPHGKFTVYHPRKELFIEMDYVNGVAEGKKIIYKDDYKIEEVWQNNELVAIDTIR